ncbi:MAG: outer membrane lipoprotein chaperone LolA [Gammaproteobacteria bacterium]|nr:outer membrane lipoprotein chaperone LolA [Gammaproteobacteria bacterium]
MKIKVVGFVFCILISATATAGEGLERLRSFSANLKSMQADFTQTIFDDQMRQLEVSRGQVVIQKPGKFRWDYKVPYVQHIVADGEKVWLYDPELEQVTVKPMVEALGSAPIALLSGEGDLDKQFKFTELGNIDGRQFVQLEVKIKDTDYGLMLLALGKENMDVMELKDKLGRVTRIEFSNIKLNKNIDNKQFHFDIPKGVDVIGQ